MTMKYKIRNREVLLPDDHLLPAYQKDHPTYDMMFDPIYKAIGAYAPERYFVDVGGNVGDTAIVMRHNATNPVLCIEGSPQFLVYLRENIEGLSDIRVVPAFIGPDEFDSRPRILAQGGTARPVIAPESDKNPLWIPRTRSLRSILEVEEALRSGIALFKTDTDGMDAFILQEFLKLDQWDTALFFECDVWNTIGEETHAAWRSVFGALLERGYSLIVFDNFGYRIASCSPAHYDRIWELIAYVEEQHLHQCVHVHYLDVWAFPPEMVTIFEEVRRRDTQPNTESKIRQRQPALRRGDSPPPTGLWGPILPPSGYATGSGKPGEIGLEMQAIRDRGPEDWSYWSARVSDLQVELLRTSKTVEDQRRVIELLSEELAEATQQKSMRSSWPWRIGWHLGSRENPRK